MTKDTDRKKELKNHLINFGDVDIIPFDSIIAENYIYYYIENHNGAPIDDCTDEIINIILGKEFKKISKKTFGFKHSFEYSLIYDSHIENDGYKLWKYIQKCKNNGESWASNYFCYRDNNYVSYGSIDELEDYFYNDIECRINTLHSRYESIINTDFHEHLIREFNKAISELRDLIQTHKNCIANVEELLEKLSYI